MRNSKQFLGILLVAVCAGSHSTAWAQDATTEPQTTVPGQTPSNQTDTTSPLTPLENPNAATPLTPTSPAPGTTAPTNTAGSSSETPPAFIQAPLEKNRLDPSAPSPLALIIDPGSQSSLLNTDSLSLQPLSLFPAAPGVSLYTLEQTTTMNGSPSGSSTLPLSRPTSFYPARLSGPTSTAGFSPSVSGLMNPTTTATTPPGSSSTSMAPLVGSAAVNHVSPVQATFASQMSPIGAPMPMRSFQSHSMARDFGSAQFRSNGFQPSFGVHTRTSAGHAMGGGHH